jgi:hypothetical protein
MSAAKCKIRKFLPFPSQAAASCFRQPDFIDLMQAEA